MSKMFKPKIIVCRGYKHASYSRRVKRQMDKIAGFKQEDTHVPNTSSQIDIIVKTMILFFLLLIVGGIASIINYILKLY